MNYNFPYGRPNGFTPVNQPTFGQVHHPSPQELDLRTLPPPNIHPQSILPPKRARLLLPAPAPPSSFAPQFFAQPIGTRPGLPQSFPLPPLAESVVLAPIISSPSQPVPPQPRILSKEEEVDQEARIKKFFRTFREKNTPQVTSQLQKVYTVIQMFARIRTEIQPPTIMHYAVEGVFVNKADANSMIHDFFNERIGEKIEQASDEVFDLVEDENGCMSIKWAFPDGAVLYRKVQMCEVKPDNGQIEFTPPPSASLPIQEVAEPTMAAGDSSFSSQNFHVVEKGGRLSPLEEGEIDEQAVDD